MSGSWLLIRAEASSIIGYGHAARDLALAEEWIGEGGRVCWWTAPSVPALFRDLWLAAGTIVHAADEPPPVSADIAMIDGPHYGSADFAKLRSMTRGPLMVVDDDGRFQNADADVLINPNAGAEERIRFSGKALLGTDFAWIRRSVRGSVQDRKSFSPGPRTLLVGFGGTMDDGQLRAILPEIKRGWAGEGRILVLVGQGSSLSGKVGEIEFLKDVKDMATVYRQADLFIGAGGHSLWELSYHGVPALVLTIADNQVPGVSAWSDRGLLRWIGPLGVICGELHRVGEALLSVRAESAESIAAWSERLQASIDGAGAARSLAETAARPFYLRAPRFLDSHDLWLIANDAETRRQSYRSDPIPWETHRTWFEAKLHDPDSRIWIAESGGRLVGIFRYQTTPNGETVVGVQVAPEFRGRGFGADLIRRGSDRAFRFDGSKKLIAEIKTANPTSRKAFEKAGYRLAGERTIEGHPSWVLTKEGGA